MPDPYGLCYYCSLTQDQKLELYNLIKGGQANILQRALISKADQQSQYFFSYENAEVFLLGFC